MKRLIWSALDPIEELRDAFAAHPNLTLETSQFHDEDKVLTRIWWRDALEGKRGGLAEVTDAELVTTTRELLEELGRLKRGRAKGAGA